MSVVFDLKTRLHEMGIEPKKAFGQNFLVNSELIRKIVARARECDYQDLIELGPGIGALTEEMIAHGMKPRLLELDRDLVTYWRDQRGFEVVEGDALQIQWQDLKLREPSLLVSNLPYQISTSLVVERCFGPLELKWMVLMFQKEVAQRLMAETRTKEYGLLSVLAQVHFRIRKVADAAPRDFFPAPKVASRVLLFERQNVQGLGRPFLRFVKQAFVFRRKFLLKNLKGVVDKAKMVGLPATFAELGLSEKVRAEELTPEQFVQLFRKIYEH